MVALLIVCVRIRLGARRASSAVSLAFQYSVDKRSLGWLYGSQIVK